MGYSSVGCTHCTAMGKAREGRWMNKSKTECGLHS
jgi:phosphoadenosine phosphosulfate reductase